MTTVTIADTPVQEFTSGGSITVPSGEVWKVTITSMSSSLASTDINGSRIFKHGDDLWHDQTETVVVGGDTINAGSGVSISVTGYEVSGTIDNTAVSEQGDPNTSVTVPSGEVWDVSISVSSEGEDAILNVNGNELANPADFGGTEHHRNVTVDTVLTGGDTVSISTTNGQFHIGGFVVN